MFPYPFPVMPVMHSQDLLTMRGIPPGMQAFNPYFAPQMQVPNPNFISIGNANNNNTNNNFSLNSGGQSPHNNRQQYDERNQNNRQNAGGRGNGRSGGRGNGRGGRGSGRGRGGMSSPGHEGGYQGNNNHNNRSLNNLNDPNAAPKFQHKRPEQFQLPPKGIPTIITPPPQAFVAGMPTNGLHPTSGVPPGALVAASNCLSSPFLPASHAQHLSPLTAPAAPFMALQFVPMSPKSPLTIGGAFGTVSSVPPPRAMPGGVPVLMPVAIPAVEANGPSVDVPDFDADMFRLREMKLVELIKEWMNTPQNNPKQGSLPSERVQNCIKSLFPQLYASVIGSEYANQWHRFVKSHLDCFEIVYPGGEGRCLPRIRLLTHDSWEAADKEENQERKSKELWVIQTLQHYLESFPQHEASIEDFIREFPKLAPMLEEMSPNTIPSNESPPARSNGNSNAPRFRDIVRLIKKYKENFTFIASRPGSGMVPRVRLLTPNVLIGAPKEMPTHEPTTGSKDGLSPPTIPLVPMTRDGAVKKAAPPGALSVPDNGLAPLRAPSPVSMGECLIAIEPMTSMPAITATQMMFPHSPTTAPAAFASWNLMQSWAAMSPPVASPAGMWSASASPTANSSPHAGSPSGSGLSPMAAQLKRQHSKQSLQPGSPSAIPQTPQTQTSSVQSPMVGTPLGMVPDSDPHLMPLRELKLRNLVVQYLESPTTNPTKGSLPSERVQNWVKVQHADLYKSVIGAGFGNQWHRFISKYDTFFHLFTVQEYARTIWRMRLAAHTDWETADERERTHKRVKEDHYVDCLTKFLQCRNDHRCTMDDFLAAYPQLVQNREWPRSPMAKDLPQSPPLPARGDFARFVRRHWELFNYDNKSFTITLVGVAELERAPTVLAEVRRREEMLCSPNTSPTATPLSLLSAQSPPTLNGASPTDDSKMNTKWDQRYAAQQRDRRVPLRQW